MKQLTIKNLGPVKHAELELKKINIILGTQSSGKSCVLKVASFCSWLEKKILTTPNQNQISGSEFFNLLEQFHKLHGYTHEDTYICYETDYIKFSCRKNDNFDLEIKGNNDYSVPKISYIPAERNLVAVIPNWFQVKFNDDNIRDFMSDWETARQMSLSVDILNLNVTYQYNQNSQSDKVKIEGNGFLDLTDTSSGLQSLIPLFVHLNFLYTLQYQSDKKRSILEENNLVSLVDKYLKEETGEINLQKIVEKLTKIRKTDRCEIFLEEPELNLFPPTQDVLSKWLIEKTSDDVHNNKLFIATHSPYILTSFLEENLDDFSLFLINKNVVKTASEAEIQEIYDYGVDAFFNISAYA